MLGFLGFRQNYSGRGFAAAGKVASGNVCARVVARRRPLNER
jgi:hypothetical protein